MGRRWFWFTAVLLLGVLVIGCQSEGEPTSTLEDSSDESLFPVPFTPTIAATQDPEQPTASTAEPQLVATQSDPESAVTEPGDLTGTTAPESVDIIEYPVPPGSRPHDVAPAPDGTVWYTAQGTGELGRLNPDTGETHHIPLGPGSSPHGVIVGPDESAWVTDSGLNAIVRVDPKTESVETFRLPDSVPNANLNTAAFDSAGVLWFTGQNGVYGRLDPQSGRMDVFEAPRGRGPYGIDATPGGDIYYSSLAGSYLGAVDTETGEVTVLEPPTPNQGARRVWSDSSGILWVSEWNAGQVARYDPARASWEEWRLPGDRPQPYAVYVDENDHVWLSDFGSNSMVRFELSTETFDVFPLPSSPANVRQILGRPGEVWGAESGVDKLVVIRTDP